MTVRLIRNRDALEVDLIGLRDMGQDLIQSEGDYRESLTADFLAWDKRASITLPSKLPWVKLDGPYACEFFCRLQESQLSHARKLLGFRG